MHKQFLFFLTVLLSISEGYSDNINFIWGQGKGGVYDDISYSCVYDEQGNMYVTGSFKGVIYLDPATQDSIVSNGVEDVFVCKFGSSGNLLWAKQIGSSGRDFGYAIAIDSLNNLFITGCFSETIDFDPSSVNTFYSTSNGYNDIFLLKLNAQGDFIWAKTFGGAFDDFGYSVKVDKSNNVIFSGSFSSGSGPVDFDFGPSSYLLNGNLFISKVSDVGDFVWAKSWIGTLDSYSIGLDRDKNIFVTGKYSGTIDFDPDSPVFNLNSGGGYLLKLDSNGVYSWVKDFADNNIHPYSIVVDNQNSIIIGGQFAGIVNFNLTGGSVPISSAGGFDIFIAKFNALGELTWVKKIGGVSTYDDCRSITFDNDGAIYFTGCFSDTVDFDPSTNVYNLSSGPSSLPFVEGFDVFVCKYSQSGEFIWAERISDPGTVAIGLGIDVDKYGSIYLTGGFSSTADFDVSNNIYLLNNNGRSDFFCLKYCQVPMKPVSILGISGLCPGTQEVYSVSPILFSDTYVWNLPVGWTGSSNSDSISVTAGSNNGNISVYASNSCGVGLPESIQVSAGLNVTVNSTTICEGDTVYLVAEGADSYIWSSDVIVLDNDSVMVFPISDSQYTVIGSTSVCQDSSISIVSVNPNPLKPSIVQNGFLLSSSSSYGNNWYYNGLIQPTDTLSTLNVFYYGFYSVKVIIEGCSSEMSDSILFLNNSIVDVEDNSMWSIFPNPTSGMFSIMLNFSDVFPSEFDMEIYDLMGALVFRKSHVSGENQRVSVNGLSRGTYFIRLINYERQYEKVLIVN